MAYMKKSMKSGGSSKMKKGKGKMTKCQGPGKMKSTSHTVNFNYPKGKKGM